MKAQTTNRLLLGVVLPLLLAPALQAATATVGSSADAGLFEFAPDNNLGGMFDVPAGSLGSDNGGGARNRALFKFDIASQVPQNAIIESVTLTLYVTLEPSSSAQGSEYFLHRVLTDWGEGSGTGNQGETASPGDVTWNSNFDGISTWGIPGGQPGVDFVAAGSASTFVDAAQTSFQWISTPELIADVQAWLLDSSTNFGWMLISGSEVDAWTAKRFATKEYNTESQRPSLEIQYSVIPEPGALALLSLSALGIAGLGLWRREHSTEVSDNKP